MRQWLPLGMFLLFSLVHPNRGAADSLPHQMVRADLAGENARSVEDGSRVLGHAAAGSSLVSFTQRQALSPAFDWTWGVHHEFFSFGHVDDFSIHQLQSYAAEFSLEYIVNHQVAASIRLRPGFYFENHPTLNAWDIPIQATTGIPLLAHLQGAVGIDNGRFYHHPLPIGGLIWTVSDRVTLNALYPEPSLEIILTPQLSSSFGGELLGGGFKTDSFGASSRIQYYEYRIGETLTYEFQPSWKLVVGSGYQWRRVFDLYRDAQSPEADGGVFLHLGLQYSR